MPQDHDPRTARTSSRQWENKQSALIDELERTVEKSPILRILRPPLRGEDFVVVVGFEIPTLVSIPAPDGNHVQPMGPVIAGIRYRPSFLEAPPVPWEIVSILGPPHVFLPNVHPSGGLCLGRPPRGIDMESILHLCFAALILDSYSTLEWEGLNPAAAEFVRRNAKQFPLVETGLFERPDPRLHCPFPARLNLDEFGEPREIDPETTAIPSEASSENASGEESEA